MHKETRTAYKYFGQNSDGKRSGRRWEDNFTNCCTDWGYTFSSTLDGSQSLESRLLLYFGKYEN
jgi:hypothetical protein